MEKKNHNYYIDNHTIDLTHVINLLDPDSQIIESNELQGGITAKIYKVQFKSTQKIIKECIIRIFTSQDIKKQSYAHKMIILSTSRGLMRGSEAKKQSVGGEVLCTIE